MNHGDNSLIRRFMEQTLMPRVFVADCQRPAKSENLNGVPLSWFG
jgi:hypothetical protein